MTARKRGCLDTSRGTSRVPSQIRPTGASRSERSCEAPRPAVRVQIEQSFPERAVRATRGAAPTRTRGRHRHRREDAAAAVGAPAAPRGRSLVTLSGLKDGTRRMRPTRGSRVGAARTRGDSPSPRARADSRERATGGAPHAPDDARQRVETPGGSVLEIAGKSIWGIRQLVMVRAPSSQTSGGCESRLRVKAGNALALYK